MSELVDVRADAVAPGECICLSGTEILVTAVEAANATVDLHTCFGPALRFLRADVVPLVVADEASDAA
jgi:hypothetical protein